METIVDRPGMTSVRSPLLIPHRIVRMRRTTTTPVTSPTAMASATSVQNACLMTKPLTNKPAMTALPPSCSFDSSVTSLVVESTLDRAVRAARVVDYSDLRRSS